MLRRITLSIPAVIAFAFLAASCATTPRKPSASEASFTIMPGQRPPVIEMLPIAALNGLKIRAGYYPEFEGRELKGCVLYLQGLGDSSLNHVPFFSYLNASGYRVLFFDYMGQGGSEGSMNDTRIIGTTKEKKYEIQTLADAVWDKYKCEGQTKKAVIGWSTGGLAGYRMAYEKKVDAAVLFAPGLHPRWFVGEAAHRPDRMLSFSEVITTRTLTRRGPENNAIEVHVDAVKPNTPSVIPKFALNLLSSAKTARKWWMPKEVQGFVALSGDEDTYVDTNKNRDTLQDRARNFTLIQYEHSLHELDNELPEVINDLYPRVVAFLDGVFKP